MLATSNGVARRPGLFLAWSFPPMRMAQVVLVAIMGDARRYRRVPSEATNPRLQWMQIEGRATPRVSLSDACAVVKPLGAAAISAGRARPRL